MIIACDGIWDCMSSQDAVSFVHSKIGRFKKPQEKPKLSTIVEQLLEKICATDVAGSAGIGTDNMTCMIVEFKNRPNNKV